jgi:hypothetical protein
MHAHKDKNAVSSSGSADGVTTVTGSLAGMPNLTRVTFADEMTRIPAAMFAGLTSLTSYSIPEGVTSVGSNAFYGCTALTSVTIPNSVRTIEHFVFRECTSLTDVVIPNSVTSIGNSAFSGCTSLTNIVMPDSITSISSSTFSGCTSLTDIVIPDSVTNIYAAAFSGCTSLTAVSIPVSVTQLGTQNGSPFIDMSTSSAIIFEPGTTSIPQYAFLGITAPLNAHIPQSVTYDGMETAFRDADGLPIANVTVVGYEDSDAIRYAQANSLPYRILILALDRLVDQPVRYVPYQYIFRLLEDAPPRENVIFATRPADALENSGLTLLPNGEIYGAPLFADTFAFTLLAHVGNSIPDEMTVTLEIQPRTDENVENANHYAILIPVGEDDRLVSGYYEDMEDLIFMVSGEYTDFAGFWIDGFKRTRDTGAGGDAAADGNNEGAGDGKNENPGTPGDNQDGNPPDGPSTPNGETNTPSTPDGNTDPTAPDTPGNPNTPGSNTGALDNTENGNTTAPEKPGDTPSPGADTTVPPGDTDSGDTDSGDNAGDANTPGGNTVGAASGGRQPDLHARRGRRAV